MNELVWKKLGLVFSHPPGDISHAQVPTPWKTDGGLKILFASRTMDRNGLPVSHVRLADFSSETLPPNAVVDQSYPVLFPNSDGGFTSSGVMPGSVLTTETSSTLFFTGWHRSADVPYELAIGQATWNPVKSQFVMDSPGPVLSKSETDPYTQAQPTVFLHEGKLRMIYQSGTGWVIDRDRREPVYRLRIAEFEPRCGWKPANRFLVPTVLENECQTSPTILKVGSQYLMLFGYRAPTGFRDSFNSYKLGFAHSNDLETWSRLPDNPTLLPTPDRWDSQMTTYPSLLEWNSRILLLYCGNNFGREGFGLAELLSSDISTYSVIC